VDTHVKWLLETAFDQYHSHYYLDKDPVHFVHRYADRRDQEVVALFSAVLAYGNVPTILSSIRKVLGALDPNPHQALLRASNDGSLVDFKHRFTRGIDLQILCHWLGSILENHGSLENFFLDSPQMSLVGKLSSFVERTFEIPLPRPLAKGLDRRRRSLFYLLPNPKRGSACKRLNLFLRWMVRPNDGIDLGLWTRMRPSELILPVDTHLLKALRLLSWTRSKTATWKVAEAATAELRKYAPHDPIRYDFALCHLSMEGGDILGKRRATLE
jgi:uncharacterized protein (TIGR02757 family)